MTDVLHLSGPVLVGPDEVVGEAWVVGGRLTFERPAASATDVAGWAVPGLGDAHRHVGPRGAPSSGAPPRPRTWPAGWCPASWTRTATSGWTRTAPWTTPPPRSRRWS